VGKPWIPRFTSVLTSHKELTPPAVSRNQGVNRRDRLLGRAQGERISRQLTRLAFRATPTARPPMARIRRDDVAPPRARHCRHHGRGELVGGVARPLAASEATKSKSCGRKPVALKWEPFCKDSSWHRARASVGSYFVTPPDAQTDISSSAAWCTGAERLGPRSHRPPQRRLRKGIMLRTRRCHEQGRGYRVPDYCSHSAPDPVEAW